MKEELLRIENGLLPVKNKKIILDLEISRGECVGIFPDSISDSDMILNFFRGTMDLKTGKTFICEEQADSMSIHREISNRVAVLERKTNIFCCHRNNCKILVLIETFYSSFISTSICKSNG